MVVGIHSSIEQMTTSGGVKCVQFKPLQVYDVMVKGHKEEIQRLVSFNQVACRFSTRTPLHALASLPACMVLYITNL